MREPGPEEQVGPLPLDRPLPLEGAASPGTARAGGAAVAAAVAAPRGGERRLGGYRVLRHRDFRLIAAGNTVSQLGFWAQYVAVGWAASSLTRSQFLITLAFSAQFWPALVFSPLAGLFADRHDRRRLVMFGNLAMAVPPLVIGLLIQNGAITLLSLVALVFVGGIGQAFTQPATVAFIPALVPPEDVPAAIAANAGLTNSTRIIGPTVAGLAIAAWGVGWGFHLNAASFLAVTVACILVRTRPQPRPRSGAGTMADLRSGLAYARSNPVVTRLVALMASISFLLMHAALMPIFARRVLHGGVSTYGLLSAAPGVGFVVGAVAMSWLYTGRRQRGALVVGAWGIGLALLVVAASRSIPLTVVALGAFGACQFTVNTTATTMLVGASEDAFRGRVMGLFMMLSVGVIPVNSVVAGGLASLLGAPLTVGLCGATVLVATGLFCATGSLQAIRAASSPSAGRVAGS